MVYFSQIESLDISRLQWGSPPVPPMPSTLRQLLGDEHLPKWLISEANLAENSTAAMLGPSFWKATPSAPPRLEHYVHFLVRARSDVILEVRCFEKPWPPGLRMADIPFSARSRNLLAASSFMENPDRLMDLTYAQLLRIPGLGIKSLIEIVSLVEAAIEMHANVATNLSVDRPTDAEGTDPSVTAWRGMASEVLQASWVGQISEKDPRFRNLLPPGSGTLEDRLERIISDPQGAASNAPALIAALPEIRKKVVAIENQFLEDSLLELISAAMGSNDSRIDVIASRLGWNGDDPLTLQECGDSVGLTRERVRQIEEKVKKRIGRMAVFLPKLDLAINLLEAEVPILLSRAGNLLKERNISRKYFSPISLLQAAELLGRQTILSISEVKGQPFLVSPTSGRALGSIRRIARRLAGKAGVASVFQVVDALAEVNEIDKLLDLTPADFGEDDVRRVLSDTSGCKFLDEDWFWFPDLPEGRNRLANVARRILSVVSPQTLASVREGVRREYSKRAKSDARYRSLSVPPYSVMANFFKHHPDFNLDNDSVSTQRPLNYRQLLGEGERLVVDVMRTSSTGVFDRKSLTEACLSRGLNESSLGVYTTYSPILEHLGLDLWKLRGIQVDPAAVAAVREQNLLRPREQRLLEHGWAPDGKLWVAWKLPMTKTGVVFGIPGAVRRYLVNRSFRAVAKDSSRQIGQISVNEGGSSYGYGPFVRYAGADEGDALLAEFDLALGIVELSLAGDEVFEQT
jgi:hypothetical protein